MICLFNRDLSMNKCGQAVLWAILSTSESIVIICSVAVQSCEGLKINQVVQPKVLCYSAVIEI